MNSNKFYNIVKSGLVVLVSSTFFCGNVHAHNIHKNSVMIILNEDGETGYALPKNAVIDVRGNSPVYKVKFTLWQEKNGELFSLKNKDYDIHVNFIAASKPNQLATPGNLSCVKNKQWRDKKPNNPLKKGKRHFTINTDKHTDGDCYTYEVTVNTGQRKIKIDPWLRIKR